MQIVVYGDKKGEQMVIYHLFLYFNITLFWYNSFTGFPSFRVGHSNGEALKVRMYDFVLMKLNYISTLIKRNTDKSGLLLL